MTMPNGLNSFTLTQPISLLLADYTVLFHTFHVVGHLECVKEYGTNNQLTDRWKHKVLIYVSTQPIYLILANRFTQSTWLATLCVWYSVGSDGV